ncbi:2-oxo acid dehydrogenase subunit E2 [Streptomyces sp. SID8379]|uniref:dihydrolipoamide acetyltransferase family protein n=1 Tax=unclassified Streptomyces TaxID=2593676 RepID=UPI0004765FFD|nr:MULTISPECIES: dihydrolipoamide acetyltransferase family protein [unclassified Streptomyces]MYW68892.1 2-oxo acid dehydrogenase subunit E2 [Streptomyces sp. SID8379]
MAQVLEFKLPDLGEGLTEATIVNWLVRVGDVVAVDQPVVEVETAKAMVEVPCPYGGVVTARFGDEGAELPVGAALLTVAVGATDATAAASASSAASAQVPLPVPVAEESKAPSASEGSGNVLVGYGTGAAPARRRRVRPAPQGGEPQRPARATPTGPPAPPRTGADAPERRAAGGGPVPVISPLVRRLAREHGLDLRQMTGSGRDGLILRSDVERAAAELAGAAGTRTAAAVPEDRTLQAPPATANGSAKAPAPQGHRTPLRGIRGAIADKLSRSRSEIPDATCWVDADATELLNARAVMNGATGPSAGPKISVLALFARICTAALARYPELNATVDLECREIVRLDAVHLGFAAQTERGLVVPVVRDAHARGAESLSAEFGRLTESARAGTLTPEELTGGTFTLNNYGVFGVDGSTPIINHPEAAMLGVGRIAPKAWVHEGELAVRQVVQLSLTFDHRVCDGGTAGGFLRYVADCVERPAVLLRTL